MTITKSKVDGVSGRSAWPRVLLQLAVLAGLFQSGATMALAVDPLDRSVTLDISTATSLEDALIEWGAKVGVTVMINTSTIDRKITQKVQGTFTARVALLELLRDSGLTYTEEGDRIRIVPTKKFTLSNLREDSLMPEAPVSSDSEPSATQTTVKESHRNSIEEVVVTAQKREERLQDVPIPVTALTATSLVENNEVKIQDYYTQIPGLSFSPGLFSSSLLSIRGITTGGALTTSTVGVMIDDVPFGGTGQLIIPDFDPGDLARIEVLRGPQGTLYGASSMGGLLKFVTVDPTTTGISGRVEGGASDVHNGAEAGYNFRGSINVPLSSDLAVRVNAFHRQDPGYIDNPVLGIKGANEDHADGAHVAVLWSPLDTLSVKLSALYQDTRADSTSDFTTIDYITAQPLGDLQQGYIRGAAPYDTKVQAYSVTLKGKIGGVDVTSITGFNINHNTNVFDVTPLLGPYTLNGVPGTAFNGFGVLGTPSPVNASARKVTQEVRLSAPIGQSAEILLGGYYTHENSSFTQVINATDPYTAELAGQWLGGNVESSTFREYAAFVDFTYHFTERFQVQLGGRESEIRTEAQPYLETGPFLTALSPLTSPYLNPGLTSKSNPFTYLFTPQFKFSPDVMLYVRLASGYRPGGPNQSLPGAPAEFKPDKTNDYEIGLKADVLDRTLSFDMSVYYISWKDIQLGLTNLDTGVAYTGNAGNAKSQGVEISVESRPLGGLRIAGWVAIGEAELTQAFPPGAVVSGTYGAEGDPLPDSSRFSGNLSADEEVPLSTSVTGYAGASVSYVGQRWDVFNSCAAFLSPGMCTAAPPRQELPAYARTDIHAGVRYDTWNAHVYLNNVTDRRGLTSGGLGNSIPYSFYFIQPRTVGISLSKSF
jgi:iron complex outermembrane recepter protein